MASKYMKGCLPSLVSANEGTIFHLLKQAKMWTVPRIPEDVGGGNSYTLLVGCELRSHFGGQFGYMKCT